MAAKGRGGTEEERALDASTMHGETLDPFSLFTLQGFRMAQSLLKSESYYTLPYGLILC